jgi:hypothetical protein
MNARCYGSKTGRLQVGDMRHYGIRPERVQALNIGTNDLVALPSIIIVS